MRLSSGDKYLITDASSFMSRGGAKEECESRGQLEAIAFVDLDPQPFGASNLAQA